MDVGDRVHVNHEDGCAVVMWRCPGHRQTRHYSCSLLIHAQPTIPVSILCLTNNREVEITHLNIFWYVISGIKIFKV